MFSVPEKSQSIARQMVTENDRLWSVPRKLLQGTRPSVNRLGQVNVPTLILIGANDTFQREQAELLAKQVPNARLVVIPGRGHFTERL